MQTRAIRPMHEDDIAVVAEWITIEIALGCIRYAGTQVAKVAEAVQRNVVEERVVDAENQALVL